MKVERNFKYLPFQGYHQVYRVMEPTYFNWLFCEYTS